METSGSLVTEARGRLRKAGSDRKVRWVDYARRSMQRLGFLKVLVTLASGSGPLTLQALTDRFEGAVNTRQVVPEGIGERLRNYAAEQRRRSKELETRPFMQDLYLSDPALPSRSGAITGEMERVGYRHAVYVEMPAWAVRLNLLRDRNYTPTDRGGVIAAIAPDVAQQFRIFDPLRNPLLLSPGERYVFLFCLLDADGDLIRETYRLVLTSGQDRFSRSELGEIAKDALKEIVATKLRHLSAGPERVMAAKAAEVIRAVESQEGQGMGPRESLATPRTEPLVDCGILAKSDRSQYVYELTKGGRQFLEVLAETSVAEFLEERLSKATAELLGGGVSLEEEERIFGSLSSSYSRLRTGLGYVSILEASLLAVAAALEASGPLFELKAAEEAIYRAAQEHGKQIRLTNARGGGLAQFRVDPRLLESLV